MRKESASARSLLHRIIISRFVVFWQLSDKWGYLRGVKARFWAQIRLYWTAQVGIFFAAANFHFKSEDGKYVKDEWTLTFVPTNRNKHFFFITDSPPGNCIANTSHNRLGILLFPWVLFIVGLSYGLMKKGSI